MALSPEDLQTLQQVRTLSIHQRPHKVTVHDFMNVHNWQSPGHLRTLFPRILKGHDIAAVVDGLVAAHRRDRAVIFAMGAHVI
jgi:hypothetical protein